MIRGITALARFAGRWFAVLVVLGGVVGLLAPGPTSSLAGAIPLLLGVIMFGMGLTLRPADFAIVAQRPQAVAIGVVAQFLVMPLAGWGVGWVCTSPRSPRCPLRCSRCGTTSPGRWSRRTGPAAHRMTRRRPLHAAPPRRESDQLPRAGEPTVS